jgi:uncharacterized protein
MQIIDTDIHPIPDMRRVQERLAEPWRSRLASGNRGPGPLGYWNPNGVYRADAVTPDADSIAGNPKHLAHYLFDEYNLEYGIFNPGLTLSIGTSPESEYASALLSAINDVFVEEWLPVDPRFRTSIVVAPTDPMLAVREIERLGDHPGVVQVLMPSASMLPYGHRYFHPIYAAAAERGLPVAIHPGTEGAGMSGRPTAAGYPSSYLEWHTGLVGNYLAHLVSLVTEGVFQRFPALTFVMIEAGAFWLPSLMWRLDKNWKGLRQTTPWLDRLPSEIIADHVRFTTQPLEEPPHVAHFHQLLEMFPAERMLMFSTDYPHWDADTPDFAQRHLPESLRGRVMHEIARELYRLGEVRT